MHSTQGPNLLFFHNGDYSGAIVFRLPGTPSEETVWPDGGEFAAPFSVLAEALQRAGNADRVQVRVRTPSTTAYAQYGDQEYAVTVPTADLRVLVARRMQDDRIAQLEAASEEQLFAMARDNELAVYAAGPHDWS